MKYKVIASDLDGTINDKYYKISNDNIRAINYIINKGLKFVLCSGRSNVSLYEYEKILNLEQKGCYGIAFNGAVIYEVDTRKILFEKRLEKKIAIDIIKLLKKILVNYKIDIAVYIDYAKIFTDSMMYARQEFNKNNVIKVNVVDNLIEGIEKCKKNILKILLIGDNNELKNLYNEIILKNYNINYEIVFSGSIFLEILSKGTNKAEGLKILSKKISYKMEEVISIGDNYNDIEMIKYTGFGIVVANAVEPLKKVADYVTKRDNNNSAIVEAVEKILEINK